MGEDNYKKARDSIICRICFEIPIDPIECIQCCQLFCMSCIYTWYNKSSTYLCPLRCQFGSLKPIQGAFKLFFQIFTQQENNDDMMKIVNDRIINWEKALKNRDKVLIEIALNWLRNVHKF